MRNNITDTITNFDNRKSNFWFSQLWRYFHDIILEPFPMHERNCQNKKIEETTIMQKQSRQKVKEEKHNVLKNIFYFYN